MEHLYYLGAFPVPPFCESTGGFKIPYRIAEETLTVFRREENSLETGNKQTLPVLQASTICAEIGHSYSRLVGNLIIANI